MTTKPFPPQTQILDIGILGHHLLMRIQQHLQNACDYDRNIKAVAHDLYQTTIEDIVRLLDKPPIEAIEIISRSFPRNDKVRQTLRFLSIREPDVFITTLREHALVIFSHIRSQTKADLHALYSLKRVGRDYILVEKSHFPF